MGLALTCLGLAWPGRYEPGVVANLYFAYMLTLCALLDCRERLVACNYLGEGEGVRPLMRQLVDAPLLSAKPVQRAAESLREHARSDNAQARRRHARPPPLTHPYPTHPAACEPALAAMPPSRARQRRCRCV